jgi:putative transposase
VKTTELGGEHGYDGHKKINGRKRHILVDTLGLLLAVVVTAGNVDDAMGGQKVVGKLQLAFCKPGSQLPKRSNCVHYRQGGGPIGK